MAQQLQQYIKRYRTYLEELHDIRVVGLLLFGVVVLLVSWSGVKTIDSNYRLQKQISALHQENSLQELSNQNLKLQNNYYKTDQYLELSARQNFGLAAPGETELIVPKAVAMAHTIDLDKAAKNGSASSELPFWEQNFRSWVNFFMHRQQEV